jgi:Zn-dependent protease
LASLCSRTDSLAADSCRPVHRAADDPVGFIAFIIAIVLGITVHEFMHAYTAHRAG